MDLVFVKEDGDESLALSESAQLAKKAEELGYNRIWVAEHHNTSAIASAATSVVIGHLAGATKRIRVGSGGIMLPNHSPLTIAEQFGTLEALFPGRIDLGLGRAPGTDPQTIRALRKDPMDSKNFPEDVLELKHLLSKDAANDRIQAFPGTGAQTPLWILGSSLFGADLAAKLGLPYSFASHFAPDALDMALEHYRANFKPSYQLEKPYVMPALNVIAADTDEKAKYLFSTHQQSIANLTRGGARFRMQKPIDDIEKYWSPQEKMMASHMLTHSVVGSAETVKRGVEKFIERTQADELMISMPIYNLEDHFKSLGILSKIFS